MTIDKDLLLESILRGSNGNASITYLCNTFSNIYYIKNPDKAKFKSDYYKFTFAFTTIIYLIQIIEKYIELKDVKNAKKYKKILTDDFLSKDENENLNDKDDINYNTEDIFKYLDIPEDGYLTPEKRKKILEYITIVSESESKKM